MLALLLHSGAAHSLKLGNLSDFGVIMFFQKDQAQREGSCCAHPLIKTPPVRNLATPTVVRLGSPRKEDGGPGQLTPSCADVQPEEWCAPPVAYSRRGEPCCLALVSNQVRRLEDLLI